LGYLKNIFFLSKYLNNNKFDIIHAHSGLAGFVSSFQSKVPLVTTFHGSDINSFSERIISAFAAFRSRKSIYVSKNLFNLSIIKKRGEIIPCGVNLDQFYVIDKINAKKELGLDLEKKYVLFSASFDNKVKNYSLASEAVEKNNNLILLELKKKTREEVNLLLNACELLLVTSFNEGSPQLIKEAMACNCPIVSTDVGDVREIIQDTEGCFITNYEPDDVADKIKKAILFNGKTKGREKILLYDNKVIAAKIKKIYKEVMNN